MSATATAIAMLLLGAGLIFIAPKIVGFLLKITGIALVLVGLGIYKFPALVPNVTGLGLKLAAAAPIVGGLLLLFIGVGMAKLAVRIAGILLIISALVSLGVISR